MANSLFAGFLTPPFLALFLYSCLLQYQILQLSSKLTATTQQQQQGGPIIPTATISSVSSSSSAIANTATSVSGLRGETSHGSSSLSQVLPLERLHGIREEVFHKKSPAPQIPPKLSDEEEKRVNRKFYGGKNDPVHLGGFTVRDNNTISTNLWNFMMSELTVKSMIDVGCGKGFSSRYFYDHGVDVLCLEGSSDAVRQSLLPPNVIVQHDFSRGPWWPEETYDVVWSTEFVEHVGRQYMPNYLATFHKAALIMITSSGWGGWHHVEVHAPWWWRARMQKEGFFFSPELTERVRKQVEDEKLATGRNAQQLNGMQVFINPFVASLPKHRHLIGGHGCYSGVIDNQDGGIPCVGVDALPSNYLSLLECKRAGRGVPIWSCEKNPRASGAVASSQ